jgi:hypothetical protein
MLVRTSRIAGGLLVLAGLGLNKWTLEAFIVADGVIATTAVLSAIAVVEFVLVAAGVWLYVAAPRLRPSLAQILLLCVSTTLALAFAEAGLRLRPGSDAIGDADQMDGRRPSVKFEATDIGWRMIPNRTFQMTVETATNAYTSNAQGFRSPHDFAQPAARRVALVGDSFTWGWGVDYSASFAALLEQRLTGVEVDNVGMPGFGVDQMWQSVRTQALPLKPALVIVGFIDDDFSRSLYPIRPEEGFAKPRFEVAGGELRPQAPPGFVRRLLQHSAAWKLVDNAFIRVRPFGEWWVLNTALFDQIGRDCARQGVPVLFVRLPQLDGTPFPSLARHFQRQGLAYLDLAESAPEQQLHYQEDRHMNARGHAHVAAALAEWIAAHPGLLK